MIGVLAVIGQLVAAGGAQSQPPAIIRSAQVDPGEMVNVAVAVEPETVYVGEQATYRVAILVEETFEQQLRRYPTLAPPDVRGMLAYDLPLFHDPSVARVVAGRRFDVHVYQRAIFPLTTGVHVIAGAQIEYAVPVSAGYFSRQETVVLRADSVRLIVRDLPEAGQPAGFSGGVGRFQLAVDLDDGLRVGDPSVLRVRLAGRGNVKLLPRPAVDIPWATLVAGAERVRIDTVSGIVSGFKEFDWVITPRDTGPQTLPALSYAFFDPALRRYAAAESPTRAVVVAAGQPIADTVEPPRAILGVRRTWRGPVRDPLPTRPGFWALVVLAPLVTIAARVARRPRRIRARSAVEQLRDLARGRVIGDAGTARRLYLAALAEPTGVAAAGVSAGDGCGAVLRRAGVSPETASRAEQVLSELDRAAFAGAADGDRRLVQRGLAAVEAVMAEVRRAAPTLTALAAVAIMAAAAIAQSASAAQGAFERGLALYDAGAFAEARDAFAASARLDVQAPDAWENYGTAAWMANDTAGAIAGWQRTVRLAPRTADARRRLADAGAFDARSRAWVPALAVNDFAIPALAAWLAAWAFFSAPSRRARRWAMSLGAASLVLGAAALTVAGAVSTHDLAVIQGAAPLRVLPALGADVISETRTGDLARVLERGAAWLLIRMADGREGWIASDAAIPIWSD